MCYYFVGGVVGGDEVVELVVEFVWVVYVDGIECGNYVVYGDYVDFVWVFGYF